jgi:hypothetical protein
VAAGLSRSPQTIKQFRFASQGESGYAPPPAAQPQRSAPKLMAGQGQGPHGGEAVQKWIGVRHSRTGTGNRQLGIDRSSGAFTIIPGSRLPAPGSRLPAPGSRLPAPGSPIA